jgi:REP element-mobilizing transposase RayT
MARIPRSIKVLPNYSVHKVWRGHNGECNLGSDIDKITYLRFMNADLESTKFDAGSNIQALALMSNHSHEIFLVKIPELFSGHMRRHHSRYGASFNRANNRCGKVAQDRAHTTLIADAQHEINAVCYIHANPVRSKMVKDARNYQWSTHRLYAFGKRDPWMKNIKFPKWYIALGETPEMRQSGYRKIFARYLKEKGLVEQSFLKPFFYGPPIWRQQREELVAQWRKANRPDG